METIIVTPEYQQEGTHICLFTFALSVGSIGESNSSNRLATFKWPLAAAQSNGVHNVEFLQLNSSMQKKYLLITTHAQQLVSIETFNRDINEQVQSTSDNSNLQRK